jgi:O-antigen/teichoic acid export membrane protein
MKSALATTFVHASIYTVGIVLNRAISFIMLPLYTHVLSPKDYGILELLEMTVDVVTIVTGMGVLHGLFKFYHDYQEREEKNELVSTLFTMVIALYFVASLAGGFFAHRLASTVLGSGEYADLVRLSFVNLFLQFLIYPSLAYLRVRQKSTMFVAVNAIKLFIQVFLNILFIVYLKMGVAGVLYGTMLSSLAIGGWLLCYTLAEVRFHFCTEKAKRLLRFGLPFVVSSLGAFILTFSDRYFLNYYRELSVVGVYALAYKFGFLLITFPVGPLMNIWMVQRFELVSKEGYERIFNQFLSWFCIVTVAVMLGIAVSVGDLLQFMSAPAFWPAAGVVPVILMAYFLQACTDFFNFGIYYTGKTEHIAYGTIVAVLAIVGLSFLLIPKYGMYGAAWATLLSFGVRLIYVYWASQRLYRVEYALARPAWTTALGVAIYLIYQSVVRSFPPETSRLLSLSLGATLFFAFLLLLFHLNLIDSRVRRLILESMRSPLKTFGELRALYHT